jgi:uncharacterized protein with beta-barrel porin domain
MKSLLLCGVALAALTCASSAATAQTAFIYQLAGESVDTDEVNLRNKLTTAGFTATIGTTLPSLGGFKEVWDLNFNNIVLTPSVQSAYLAYLQAGGTLFLMGENTGFATRDNSILSFLAAAGAGSVPANAVTAQGLQTVQGTLATTPNAVPAITFLASAGIVNVGNGLCLTKDINGVCSTIGFPVSTLTNGKRGTVVVVFDVNFLGTNANAVSQLFIANLIAFLASGGGGSLTLPLTGFNVNQTNVGTAINNAAIAGNSPAAFQGLLALTPAQLATALTQLSGEPATGAQQGAFQMMNAFLGLMTDPFVDGRSGAGGGSIGFAPETASLSPELAAAYAAVTKAPPLQAPPVGQRWSVWGSAYGGSNSTRGNPFVGSNDLSARAGGFATGADYRIAPSSIVGFALGGGGTSWSLATGLGGGRSDVFQAGVYGKTNWGPAYVAASFGFAEHWMSTNRTAFGLDQLSANFNAQSYGGRIEGGYRWLSPWVAVTPYAAIQAQAFHTPGYSEVDLTGGGFGLNFAGRSATDTRSELGARLDHAVAVSPTSVLTLRSKFAWAHDWVSDPTLGAVFQALPGFNFLVNGATPAHDSALASAGGELHFANGVSLIAKFDGEFASGRQTYAGTGTLRYTW